MFRFTVAVIVLIALQSTAFAGGNDGYNGYNGTYQGKDSSTSNTNSDSFAGSLAGSSVDSHDSNSSYVAGTDLSKGVPSSITPNPAVGFAVCDSAYTFSIGISGLGFGFGVPVSDFKCNLREDAKTAHGIGESVIAKEVMCTDLRLFRASYRAGRPCFPDKELLEKLSDEEMEVYNNIIAARDQRVAARVLEEQQVLQLKPEPRDELIRSGKLGFGGINPNHRPVR